MNIVETIINLIPGSAVRQLSQAIGKSEGTVRSAAAATVPSLLSSFSRMSSTESGMQLLQGELEKFNPQVLNESSESQAEKGSATADSLLGSAGISPLLSSISRSFGIGSFGAKKLVGFLVPAVLGGIAKQFSGKTISPEGLSALFTQQHRNIAHAVPSGFAGAESALRTGMDKMKDTARSLAGSARPRGRWAIPVALGLAALAAVLLMSRPRATAPGGPDRTDEDVSSRLGNDLHSAVGSITGAMSGITDEATAEAALPKISEARGKLDEIRASASLLPPQEKAKFDQLLQSHVAVLKEQSQRVGSIPGAGEKLKPALDDVMTRLSTPVGAPVEGQQEVR